MTEAAASLVIAPVIVALCFAENFRNSGSALFVCYPAPSPAFELKLLAPAIPIRISSPFTFLLI
jgi:hypothetical protein